MGDPSNLLVRTGLHRLKAGLLGAALLLGEAGAGAREGPASAGGALQLAAARDLPPPEGVRRVRAWSGSLLDGDTLRCPTSGDRILDPVLIIHARSLPVRPRPRRPSQPFAASLPMRSGRRRFHVGQGLVLKLALTREDAAGDTVGAAITRAGRGHGGAAAHLPPDFDATEPAGLLAWYRTQMLGPPPSVRFVRVSPMLGATYGVSFSGQF